MKAKKGGAVNRTMSNRPHHRSEVAALIFIVTVTVISALSLPSWNGVKKSLIRRQATITDVQQPSITDRKYSAAAWIKGFQNCEKEVCEELPQSVPSDLVGTYYRNGYGKFKIGNDEVMHPFDADGMVVAITFSNGKALFRNRFVRTKGYVTERKKRRICFRGAFGTQIPGGFLSNFLKIGSKNCANTNVIYHGSKLLALWEAGLPHRLEPDSLRTVGKYTYKGLLENNEAFTAHPKLDPHTGHLVAFSRKLASQKNPFLVHEFDSDGNLLQTVETPITGFAFMHDFAVTENYYVFVKCPLDFEPLPYVLGLKSAGQCIKFLENEKSVLYLVPRLVLI